MVIGKDALRSYWSVAVEAAAAPRVRVAIEEAVAHVEVFEGFADQEHEH